MPSVEVSAPARSSRPGRRGDSAMNRGPISSTAMPIGTLMNSTQRQENHSVMIPPSTRPSEPPPIMTPVNRLSARVRSRPSGKPETMMASTAGVAMAPPMPWMARAASSSGSAVARPPASDAAVNRATPVRKTRRRPRMSPARPPSSSRPPKVSA